ncbi:tripartite tricarboxylate transporter permease [Methanolobus sp. WCC5]|uniref:tripartite tricarboxylate transporter permease n=1 Tax=Methanolobus sp. WCC5 TaxID=3125785 RepID=UPI003243741E
MMSMLTDVPFWTFFISVFAGYLLGVVSGLVPGIHTNNFALILLALSPVLSDYGFPLVCIAAMILSNAISHTFHDIIPSIFLGAPSSDMALAVLPGHALLLEGRGAEAIRLSALGSAGSVALALFIAVPMSLLFKIAYPFIQSHISWILLFIVFIMIMTERGEHIPGQGSLAHWKGRFYALVIFLLCGFLGMFAFSMEHLMKPFISIGEPSILLPLLSGLFGSSQLIISLMSISAIPAQLTSRMELDSKRILRGIIVGGTSGSLVAWIPGISSSVATVFARLFIKEDFDKVSSKYNGYYYEDDTVLDSAKEFIVSVSGVNTCNAIFALLALAVIGRTRSGAMVAIDGLLGDVWFDPSVIVLFMCAMSLTAILSYHSTVFLGDSIHHRLSRIDYPLLCYTVLGLLFIMCLLFTGTFGLLIFVIATPMGMIASFLKIRKSHAMGVIMMPVILYFL